MAFENKTVEDINELIVTGLESELSTTFRLLPKSFIRVLAKVFSGVFITLYKQQAWIFLQLFVDTATFEEIEVLGKRLRPLVLWGELVGVGAPGEATQWAGTTIVTVTSIDTYLPKGTQLKNAATGKIYITTEAKLLSNASETVSVKCTEAGTAGNLSSGDILVTVSPLSMIDRNCTVASTTIEATDSENEDTYRNRVRNRWRVQPQGGSLADYRKWAGEVDGVLNTYIYKDDDTASGVLIYVAVDTSVSSNRIPSSAKLIEVGEACTYDPSTGEARKPIGAVIDPTGNGSYSNVKAVTVKSFDVYITGYSEDELDEFKSSCKSNLKEYFLEREPYVRGLSIDNNRSDRVSNSNIVGIVNDIAESYSGYFSGITLKKDNSEISSYSLGRGELAVLGKLYINGVEV